TRPSIISGKPVASDTSRTGRPASRIAFAVPPVDSRSTPRAASARARSTRPVLSDTDSRARVTFTGVSFTGEADGCAGMATRRCGGDDIVVCGPVAGRLALCRSALGRDRPSPVKPVAPECAPTHDVGMQWRWPRMQSNESGQATRATHAVSLLWGFAEATVFFV